MWVLLYGEFKRNGEGWCGIRMMQAPAGEESSSSLVFRRQLKEACEANPDRFAAFLNRLFNTLNWTITELISVLKVHPPLLSSDCPRKTSRSREESWHLRC